MSRKKLVIILAVLAFTGGFAVGAITNHHKKACKQVWSQYTDLPGKCVVKMGY